MALKDLSGEAMVNLSQPLLDKEHKDHKLLKGVAETAPWLGRLEGARRSLLAAQPAAVGPERLAKIQAEEAEVDRRYDDLIRGAHHVLTGLAFLARTPARREKLVRLRDHLLAGGLAMTQKTYAEEAGQAQLLEARMTAEVNRLLAGVRTSEETTLGEDFGELLGLGQRLGKLESERAAIEAGRPQVGADRVRARNQWIRAMNGLLAGVEAVADEKPEAAELQKRLLVAIGRQETEPRGSEAGPVLPVVEPTSAGPGVGGNETAS